MTTNAYTNSFHEYTAKTLQGLEEILAKELENLGAQNVNPHNRAVSFKANQEILYNANIWCRTALKILKPIYRFTATNEKELYEEVKNVYWDKYLDNDKTFTIDSVVNSKFFNHSKYVALKTKDAIVDQFREKTGARPDIDIENPDLQINIHISRERCILSLDSTGDSLHKRGYRKVGFKAPLNEVLAAGMVLFADWDKKIPLIDPMCGSGTILIEAAMIAKNIAPNLNRKHFAFQKWRDYDAFLWKEISDKAKQAMNNIKPKLYGFDKSIDAIRSARLNIDNADVFDDIELNVTSFESLDKIGDNGILIINPPYDERIVEENIDDFYKMIGDQLKKKFSGYKAWIISSNQEAMKNIGLRPSAKKTLYNGALECKYIMIPLYEGTKKRKEEDSFTD